MKNVALLFFLSISIFSYAQTDTIFKLDGETLNVNVAAIDESSVKYVYPGETISNALNKNSIAKIHFKSGRVQEFSPLRNLKVVKSCLDWKNVQISHLESEVAGLAKIGNIGAKAKGWTTLSSLSKLQDRAYDKLKMMTAMMGGNMAFTVNQNTEEAVFGNEYSSSKTPGVTVSGIAYTTRKVKPEEINYAGYVVSGVYCLKTNASGIKKLQHKTHSVEVDERVVYADNGFQKMKTRVASVPKVREFTIIHADDSKLILSGIQRNRMGKTTYYNVILLKIN